MNLFLVINVFFYGFNKNKATQYDWMAVFCALNTVVNSD
ncbi:hypothetical protein HNP38_002800 [Chryseobacterium defluvii]|uniref:Uncharacterized protein n=1 Tax=Chryseobacterium defluvii TaxID=160396 RepID=A0A840KII2_9FLAO|nr:hypothetical protein [Chryseobacterium defluvii]